MAQLRCAQTSELLAEGTPLEIATAADAFDPSDVIFDDVGTAFDPAAVRAFHAGEIDGLERALAEVPAKGGSAGQKAARDALKATITERRERVAAGRELVKAARDRMDAARERVERRRRDG